MPYDKSCKLKVYWRQQTLFDVMYKA